MDRRYGYSGLCPFCSAFGGRRHHASDAGGKPGTAGGQNDAQDPRHIQGALYHLYHNDLGADRHPYLLEDAFVRRDHHHLRYRRYRRLCGPKRWACRLFPCLPICGCCLYDPVRRQLQRLLPIGAAARSAGGALRRGTLVYCHHCPFHCGDLYQYPASL